MRQMISGLLLLAILLSVGCSPAKRIIPVPPPQIINPEPSLPPEQNAAIEPVKPLPVYPELDFCTLELSEAMLTQAWLSSFRQEKLRFPVIIIGAPLGLAEQAESLVERISEALLDSGLVYLASPREGIGRPSLPRDADSALRLAKESGADFYLQCAAYTQDSVPSLTFSLVDLKQNRQTWTDFRYYKK